MSRLSRAIFAAVVLAVPRVLPSQAVTDSVLSLLERLAGGPQDSRRVRVPTITDPRGTDFAKAGKLGQADWMLDLERRAIAAFENLGVAMTDTCINYQTIQAPTRGEHVAFGDTGVVIYSNAVCGARSNFEGGPSALAAGLTGRTPRDPAGYTLIAVVSNTYFWTPDRPTRDYLRKAHLEGTPAIGLMAGAGATGRAERMLGEALRGTGAPSVHTRSFWLLRPNDEGRMRESNRAVALDEAERFAFEAALTAIRSSSEAPVD